MTDAIREQLDRIERLGADWNGYGADPIPTHVIADVWAFLKWLPADLHDNPPYIVPLATGGVQLEWHGPDGRMFELEFNGNGRYGWLKWCPPNGPHVEGQWDANELTAADHSIRWATGKETTG